MIALARLNALIVPGGGICSGDPTAGRYMPDLVDRNV